MTKKHLIVSAAIAGFSTLGIAGLASASSPTKPVSLAQEIAQKFHLKQSEVQAVINQHKQEAKSYRASGREQRYESRLSAEVKAGKLTQAQADKILSEHQEIVNFMETLAGKSSAERQASMKQELTQVRQWAKDNDIDMKYLGFGPMMGRGASMHRDHGLQGSARNGQNS